MSLHRFLCVCASIVLVALPAALAATEPPSCATRPYAGFDSRLTIDAAGRVPVEHDAPIAFEMVGSRPVIAYKRRLIAVDGSRLVGHPSLDAISALAVDRSGGVWLQTGDTIRRFGTDRMLEAGTLKGGARLHNSGAGPFLITKTVKTATRFAFRRANGHATPAFEIEGDLRAVSWNGEGLAAVVDQSVVAWPAGAKSVTRLGEDVSYRDARDVVLIGGTRAIVTLSNLVILQTEQGRLVIAAMRARARWQNGTLYLFDERTGVIFTVKGLDQVGTRAADVAHAVRLIASVPASTLDLDAAPAFQEAARIVGCESARNLRR